MKNMLKMLLIFILGFAAGCGITGYIMNRFHRNYLAWSYSLNAAGDALFAHMLRDGNAKILLESTERNLIQQILAIHGNEELRNASTADLAFTAANRFYVCTKTEYPAEIAEIMRNLPPVQESECNSTEE